MSEISLFEANKYDLTQFNFQKYEQEALRDPLKINDYGYHAKHYILRDGPLADKIKMNTQRYGLTLDQLKIARKWHIRPDKMIIYTNQEFKNVRTIAKIIFAFTKKLMISKCCADMQDNDQEFEDVIELQQRKRQRAIDEITKQLICDPRMRIWSLYFHKSLDIDSKTVQTQINSGWAYQTYFRQVLDDDYQYVIYKFFENWSIPDITRLFMYLAYQIFNYGIDVIFTDNGFLAVIQTIKNFIDDIKEAENNNDLERIKVFANMYIHYDRMNNAYELFDRETKNNIFDSIHRVVSNVRHNIEKYIPAWQRLGRNIDEDDEELYYLYACWRCTDGQVMMGHIANPIFPNRTLDLAFSPKKVLQNINSSWINEDIDDIEEDEEGEMEEVEEEIEEDNDDEDDDEEDED